MKLRCASIRPHSRAMKSGLAPGSGTALRYAANSESNSWSSLSIFVPRNLALSRPASPLILIFHIFRRGFLRRGKSLQNSLPGSEKPHLQGVLLHPVHLLKLLERQTFYFLQLQQDPILFRQMPQEGIEQLLYLRAMVLVAVRLSPGRCIRHHNLLLRQVRHARFVPAALLPEIIVGGVYRQTIQPRLENLRGPQLVERII